MAKDQELLQAVKSKDLGAFRKLSTKIKATKTKKGNKKYNVNIQDEDGFTASHHAALTGSSEVVIGLIELESDINSRDHKGMAPLHLAAWSGKVEVARLLIEAGAHVNASSDNGDTPLILACQHGNSDVADVLLDRGCNSWSTNKSGESALDLACRFGHVHVVELLLKSKEIRSILTSGEPQKSDPPLHLASKAGHVEIVRMLLESDADLNHVTSRGTCLHEAALYGKTDVVKLLLEWGIDSNAKNGEGHTALDVVNLYTSSKASSEIKQLLKDAAAADSTVYARAVRDHFNMLDSTALSFKTGETIIVLEQNQNERWKGKVRNGEKEKVGYFPGNFVRLTSPRRGANVSGKKSPKVEPIVPQGSFEMIAVAPASPSEFNRNSPRLSSFGKKGPRHRDDENGVPSDSPALKKALVQPALPEKGLKAKKPSVKLGTGLQYVEVEVDKVPLSPPQTFGAGGGQTSNRTQYAEVLLPPNGSLQEVEECEDVPTLPRKNSKKVCALSQSEDIWVRNTAAHPPPSLPPKTRWRVSTDDSERPEAFLGRPPAPHPQHTETVGVENPAGHCVVNVSEQASKPVASPELSRKGYEDMSLSSVTGGRATPPAVDDIWKPQPVRDPRKQQPLAYENVSLPHRGKPPNDVQQSMIISDVDQPEDGDDGYVVVNQQPSKPTDPRGYENVTPGAITPGHITQGAVTSGASTSPVKHQYENVRNDEYYMPMRGGIPDAKQTDRKSTEAAGEHSEKRNSSDSTEENKDAMDYEMMKSGAAPVSHQYVNIKRQDGAGNPVEPSGTFPFKMQDYNALYDWLEKLKLIVYVDNFWKGGFDMTSVLGITAEDLTAINVKKTGHRKKILSESGKLEDTMVFPREKPKDIMTWLHLIGLEQYIPEFMDGGFDDLDFLHDMTLEDLVDIGVTQPGHQRKIWMAVKALRGGDDNGNVLEQKETIQLEKVQDEESVPQERKGYLETSLDGDDSGVSTDEIEPENARTDDSEMEFPPPPLPLSETVSEEPFVEDSSSAESEIRERLALPVPRKANSDESPGENKDKGVRMETLVSQDLRSDVPQTSQGETSPSTERLEKNIDKKADNTSLRVNEVNTDPSADSDDDEPPPRPPPPMEDMDISFAIPDPTHDSNSSGSVKSVKDMVMKENDRIRTFSLDSTFQRPKKPAAPPPLKPKNFKKPPPPALKPKPRKATSFSGPCERSFGEDSGGDRSPIQPLSPIRLDRRSSTGSNPFLSPSSPSSSGGNRQSGSGSIHSRSSSASSQGSVESIIEEFEERRRSFEKPGRKNSAPERLNTSYEYNGGRRLSPGNAARAEAELDEQIKQILRPRSREDLSQSLPTESPVSPSLVPQIEIETQSQATNEVKKAELDQVDDLMKDINNMLSDFSTELDSMFD